MGSCCSKVNKDNEAVPPRPVGPKHNPTKAVSLDEKRLLPELPQNHWGKPQVDIACLNEMKAMPRPKIKDGPRELHNFQCTVQHFPETRYYVGNLPGRREHSEFDSLNREFGKRERYVGKLGCSEF